MRKWQKPYLVMRLVSSIFAMIFVFVFAGITVTMNERQTFKNCLKQGMGEFGEMIESIGEAAGKEFAIEQALDKMQADWANKILEIAPYKTSGIVMLTQHRTA